MQYKLINKTTSQETICEKVVVNGFNYYVSDETVGFTYNKPTYNSDGRIGLAENRNSRKVIATNNPSIDVPKIVNEVMVMATKLASEYSSDSKRASDCCLGIMAGHNKSQETHPFSEDDMVEFGEYLSVQQDEDGQILNPNYVNDRVLYISSKQLLEYWKSQRIKTLYYE